MFLIKKFKKKTNVTFLELFLNAMIRYIKTHNIFYIIEISKSKDLNVLIKKNYENIYLSVPYDFFKIWWVQENQDVTFLMVPPKDAFTQV